MGCGIIKETTYRTKKCIVRAAVLHHEEDEGTIYLMKDYMKCCKFGGTKIFPF